VGWAVIVGADEGLGTEAAADCGCKRAENTGQVIRLASMSIIANMNSASRRISCRAKLDRGLKPRCVISDHN